MISAILSLFGGGLIRCLPAIIDLFHKKTDNDHEYRMMQLQLELQKEQSAEQLAAEQIKSATDEAVAQLQGMSGALHDQMEPMGTFTLIGNKIIDGFNALVRVMVDALTRLVRPVTTYYFLVLYGMYKIALYQIAVQTMDKWQAVLSVYTQDDIKMLSAILGFWFMTRVFDKAKK